MDKTFLFVQSELRRRSGMRQLMKVSAHTKISRRTLGNIIEGDDVLHSTVVTLHEYLKANVRKKDLD